MAYRYEVQVNHGAGTDHNWYKNQVIFATHEEADNAGHAKFCAWTLCEAYRVVETDEPANYRWVPGTGLVAL